MQNSNSSMAILLRLQAKWLVDAAFLQVGDLQSYGTMSELTSMLLMGVKESHPRSRSIFLRERLSTITTSCPWSLRYNDVGHPQKPSPPKTITFFFSAVLAPLASASNANKSKRGVCGACGAVNAATVGKTAMTKLIARMFMGCALWTCCCTAT